MVDVVRPRTDRAEVGEHIPDGLRVGRDPPAAVNVGHRLTVRGEKPIERDRMQIWPKLPASMASGARVLQDLEKVANDAAEGT